MRYDLLIAGVGGQGILSIATGLGRAVLQVAAVVVFFAAFFVLFFAAFFALGMVLLRGVFFFAAEESSEASRIWSMRGILSSPMPRPTL